jgi:hypothetical protein
MDFIVGLPCTPKGYDSIWVGMAAGRVVFGYDNTRPDIIPGPYTNIHTHQVNRVKKWTRTRTHRVSVGYWVSGGYATVKYKYACKLMSNTVYDRWELMNNITTCEIDKQHHLSDGDCGRCSSGMGMADGAARGRGRGTPQARSLGLSRTARGRPQAGPREWSSGAAGWAPARLGLGGALTARNWDLGIRVAGGGCRVSARRRDDRVLAGWRPGT